MPVLNQHGIYEGTVQAGLRLASLSEQDGGWAEYFTDTDDVQLDIADPLLKAQTALMMENAKRWLHQMCGGRYDAQGRMIINEATRSALVGGWSDYLFPLIRASFPTNPINDLISVQPTTRRTATVVYLNWVVGASKGSYTQGTRLFDANTGKQDGGYKFTSEEIDDEVVSVTKSGSNKQIDGTLKFNDGGGIRPGTVRISATVATDGVVEFTDNGSGTFTLRKADGTASSDTLASSAINYQTGAFTLVMSTLTFSNAYIDANYRYDSEGSKLTAEVDIQITTTTTQTERRALKINYSAESAQDVMAELGIAIEPTLVQGAAEQLNFEIARQIVAELWNVAPVVTDFNKNKPTGISLTEHFRSIMYTLTIVSNDIFSRTQKGFGNWLIVDVAAASVIESLPDDLFQRAPRPASVQGIHFIGTLGGVFRVYKDVLLSKLPGASAQGNMLMGYKGTQFWEAGFVWSPYQLLYTTDPNTTADFVTQKGMASRYATKMVNPNMYARITMSFS